MSFSHSEVSSLVETIRNIDNCSERATGAPLAVADYYRNHIEKLLRRRAPVREVMALVAQIEDTFSWAARWERENPRSRIFDNGEHFRSCRRALEEVIQGKTLGGEDGNRGGNLFPAIRVIYDSGTLEEGEDLPEVGSLLPSSDPSSNG